MCSSGYQLFARPMFVASPSPPWKVCALGQALGFVVNLSLLLAEQAVLAIVAQPLRSCIHLPILETIARISILQ